MRATFTGQEAGRNARPALAVGLRHRKDGKPGWPVATQFAEVVEVDEPTVLELRNKLTQRLGVEDRPDRHDIAFDSELLVGQVKKRIDLGADQTRLLEGRAAHDQARSRFRNSKRHDTNIGFAE